MDNVATFRFYAELNDFLARRQRQADITYRFNGHPGIKDAIEALGVPHTELDLVIASGVSVDFSYQLQDNDRVAVYPVFGALDITPIIRLKPAPLPETKFIADVHLGKLARQLRWLGFDTVYRNHYSGPEIIDIALAEHRTILTRDTGLLKTGRVTHGYWIRSKLPEDQLPEVIQRFNLKDKATPFSRCLKCNGSIYPVDKDTIAGQLEENTRKYHEKFYQCCDCRQIYWQGHHYRALLNKLAALTGC